MKTSAKRKWRISWRGWGVTAVLMAVALGFLGPKYVGQFETLRVMSMQAMLINVVIGQELYKAEHGNYTDQWSEVLPYVTQPDILQVKLQPVQGKPQTYFFGFGKKAVSKQQGYRVSLQLNEEPNGGLITALRTDNLFYDYKLTRPFPEGNVDCTGAKKSRRFCQRFLAAAEELELRNLIPVPNQTADEKNASSNQDAQ